MRQWLLALACLLVAGGGTALFMASIEASERSLARSPLVLFGARYR